ncbi:MAG: hypothetical protein CVV64_15365 [Candidatus Wallbacteria bacterium HGW-Wallbacteria-1]|jgi:hypothetical protein|uniref:UPF0210 protein CVV64_15365 n=1 Tax=Candidatus Wallbacteria bacterium HGW-Wallbacteria-1 TaxID=2013854 RepID=A0A2N1PLH3_9BACT|nr:MAG: hypothetical protein CVV64_15365 [Candidatus Wallbacteria bacterium HGW-Wallbacteria-1]
MFSTTEILETVRMVEMEHLDIRTITLGLNLLDCIGTSVQTTSKKVKEKILTSAGNLVKTADEIQRDLGIPIINKRVSVTPVSLIVNCFPDEDVSPIAIEMDKAAAEIGIDFIGGFSALVQKGFTKGDLALLRSLPKALASTKRVCASVNVGSTHAGINMDAVAMVADLIKEMAWLTRESDSSACAKFVVFCNAVEDNPFMAGAFLGVGEAEKVVSVGISGPGVVSTVVSKIPDADFGTLANEIKRAAFKITRAGELVGREAARRLNVPFGIIDLSLAPTPAIGDSVAEILTGMGLEWVGAHGTTAAVAMLNDAVKKGGAMASSHVGGLSGAFIPVSEDQGMIDAVEAGYLSLDKLEAMTCVCSVGLDMVAIPGDTPSSTIAGIIADEAAIGMINRKTTAVRIIPAYGKGLGEAVDFGGLLGKAPIMAVNAASSENFIARGGRIPAPITGMKN